MVPLQNRLVLFAPQSFHIFQLFTTFQGPAVSEGL